MKPLSISTGSVATTCVAIAAGAIFYICKNPPVCLSWGTNVLYHRPNQKFDSAKWKNDKSQRFSMVDDLIRNRLKEGLSIEEVIKILGEPDIRRGSPTSLLMLVYDVNVGHSHSQGSTLNIRFEKGRFLIVEEGDIWLF